MILKKKREGSALLVCVFHFLARAPACTMFIGKNVTLSLCESAVTIDTAITNDSSCVGVIHYAKDNAGYLAAFPRSPRFTSYKNARQVDRDSFSYLSVSTAYLALNILSQSSDCFYIREFCTSGSIIFANGII